MANLTNSLGIQFFKKKYGYDNAKAASLANPKGIYFDSDSQTIFVAGKPYGGNSSSNLTDVNFANGVLTIVHTDPNTHKETPITLDFNDTASAEATFKVFERIDDLIGPNINVVDGDGKLNYATTNYLSEVKDGETVVREAAKNLVEADTRLDAKMGVLTAGKEYTDEQISTEAKTALNAGKIATTDTLSEAINKVDDKVDAVVDEILKNEKTIASNFNSVKTAAGLSENMEYVKKTDGHYISEATDMTDAINKLDDALFNQVDGLDVNGYVQAEYAGTDNITIAGIKENNGKIERDADNDVTINVNHAYSKTDAEGTNTNSDLATVKTVRDAINSLDVDENTVDGVKEEAQGTEGDEGYKAAVAGNIHVTYKEEDGIVTVEGIKEDYTTVTRVAKSGTHGTEGHVEPSFTVTNGNMIATGNDINTAVLYAKDYTDDEIEKLNTESTMHLFHGDTEITVDADKVVKADGTEYTLKQGNEIVAKFNIEKDSFVQEGKTVNVYKKEGETDKYYALINGVETEVTDYASAGEGWYIRLVIKTTPETAEGESGDKTSEVWIPAESMVDHYIARNTHTEGEGESATEVKNNATVTIDNTANTIAVDFVSTSANTQVNMTDTLTTIATVGNTNIQIKLDALETVAANTVGGVQITEEAISETNTDKQLVARVINNSITTDKIVDKNVTEAKLSDDVQTKIDGTIHEIVAEETTELNNTTYINIKATKAATATEGTETDNQKVTLSSSVQTADAKFVAAHEEGEGEEKHMVAANLIIDNGEGKNANGLLTHASIAEIKKYVDVVNETAVNSLDAEITSDDDSVATVKVTEVDGKITDVVVTNISANVSHKDAVYTEAAGETPASFTVGDLTATVMTGAVTGKDIATVKEYIDEKAATATTTVTNSKGADGDAVKLVETLNADGHKNYDIAIVWAEFEEETVETPETPTE